MSPKGLADPERIVTAPLEQAIERAKVTLLLRHAMAGVFLTRCQWVVTTRHPTAAVDGRRLWLNPDFFLGLSPADRVFVLLHEALHLSLGHHLRAGRRGLELWNRACDYVVNAAIVEGGRLGLPEGMLFEARYSRSSAEQVYADLDRQQEAPASPNRSEPEAPSSGGEPGTGTSSPASRPEASGESPPSQAPGTPHGDVLPQRGEDGGELSQLERRRLETEHTLLLEQVALSCGSGTPALARELASRRKPTRDFREVLLRFVSEVAVRGDDFTLARRNLRYMAVMPHIVLPGSFSCRLGRVIAVVDTSGSIGAREIGSFTGALEEMLQAFAGVELTVVAADDQMHEIHEIPAGATTLPEALPLSGQGGTDFRPAIAWAEDEAQPDLLVYLTDGFGEAPEHAPGFPVLWALPTTCWSRPPAPWGELTRLQAGC